MTMGGGKKPHNQDTATRKMDKIQINSLKHYVIQYIFCYSK